MKTAFRKGFLLGIGLARNSAKKVVKEVKSFAKQHNLTKNEADELAKEFVTHFEKERKVIMKEIGKESRVLERRFRTALKTETAHVSKKVRKMASNAKKRIF